MGEKRRKPIPTAVREWYSKQNRKIARMGGEARWLGVPPEERSRLNTIASKKAAAARTAKAQARKEAAATRKAKRLLNRNSRTGG